MNTLLIDFLLLLVLIGVNGFLAMAEFSVVSARRSGLQRLADAGVGGARTALDLADAPSRFLATIQLGITLIGVLVGAIGGVSLASRLAGMLAHVPVLQPASQSISIVIVVVAITFTTLVIGELVPKRVALVHSESIAVQLAPLMRRLGQIANPLVRILSSSTDAVMRLLRLQNSVNSSVTEEDVRALIRRGTVTGVFESAEREMVERVFSFADRTVDAVMTPYPDLQWLDVTKESATIANIVINSEHSGFPVVRGSRDHVLGVAYAKDLLQQALAGQAVDAVDAAQPVLLVPSVTPVFVVLDRLREAKTTVALVIDEYGSLQGMVTATDLLEALVGELPEAVAGSAVQGVVQKPDGSWLLDGALPVDEVRLVLEIDELPGEPKRHVGTLGGLIMAELGRIPNDGARFEWRGWTFEVVSMLGRRVDTVLVVPPQDTSENRQKK